MMINCTETIKAEIARAAETAWKEISPRGSVDDNIKMFEAGVEFVARASEKYPRRPPKVVLDQLFQGLSPEEYSEKWRLLESLISGYTLEMLYYKTELYKRNTSEVDDFKRRYEEDVKKNVKKARSEAIGVLDAVAAMLKNSTQGTHRMKEFYAYSIINFIKEAKAGLEVDFSTDELPF